MDLSRSVGNLDIDEWRFPAPAQRRRVPDLKARLREKASFYMSRLLNAAAARSN
jgi:hypothetical protein